MENEIKDFFGRVMKADDDILFTRYQDSTYYMGKISTITDKRIILEDGRYLASSSRERIIVLVGEQRLKYKLGIGKRL